MEGRSYNRAVRFYKLSYEAFRRVAWAGFLQWIESRHPQDAAQINKALEHIGSLADNLQKLTHDHVFHGGHRRLKMWQGSAARDASGCARNITNII